MIKKQFTLYLENKPGALAGVTRKLAKAGINIEAISAYTSADVGLVQIVVSSAAKAKKLLADMGVAYTVQDVALLTLENEAGSLAAVAAKLARSGVNINYIYATGCECSCDCRCDVIVSAPDLAQVESVWQSVQK